MVKGVARHAVIVQPQEGRAFEQAIFILGDAEAAPVRTPEELLALAGDLAVKYCVPARTAPRRKRVQTLLRSAAWFLCGSGVTALLWWLLTR